MKYRIFFSMFGAAGIAAVLSMMNPTPVQARIKLATLPQRDKVSVRFEQAPYETARWVSCDDAAELKRFLDAQRQNMATDRDGAHVYLARNAWELGHTQREWPKIKLATTREQA